MPNQADQPQVRRRRFSRQLLFRTVPLALAVVVSLLSATASTYGNQPDSASLPHIVLLLADDMGYGDPGCYNAESKIATPAIDRLAAEGIRLTDAHSAGAFCVQSRYGLLVGRFPFRAKLNWGRQAVIEADRPTLPGMLRSHGYRTAMIGKWHQGLDGGPNHDWSRPLVGGPVDRGFDSYFGIPASLDQTPYYFIRGNRPVEPPTETIAASDTPGWSSIQGAFWRAGGIAPGFKHAEVLPKLTDEALRVIREHDKSDGGGPLFLYVALPAPHTPWLPEEKYLGKSGAGLYGDFVLQVDDTVRRITQALADSGMLDETLLIFSSDNGPTWYPADVQRLGHSAAGPLRGMKGDAWEGGHRVPLIVRWPGQVEPASVSSRPVCFTDVMATLADVIGKPLPEGAGPDSVSFLPALLGKPDRTPRPPMVLKGNGTVICEGRWKLITHLGSGGFSAPRQETPTANGPAGQLYDLQDDLGETTNLWQKHPDIVAHLLAELKRIKGQ